MNNFDTVFRGYDKEQVKKYLDNVIKEYERLLNDKKDVDRKVSDLEEKLKYYTNLEDKFTRAIITAENAGDEIKKLARNEAETLINDAKRNANRIINDALMETQKLDMRKEALEKSIKMMKSKVREVLTKQFELIDEIEIL